MNRQQAINYLLSSGFSEEQINTIEQAFKQEPTNDLVVDLISRADVLKLMKDNWHTHNGDWAMQESMDDIRALPSVTPQEPKTGQYEKHTDHTDCIWYVNNNSRCPVTCSQYRDGWNDAMDYIFKNGKGYQPYRHDG